MTDLRKLEELLREDAVLPQDRRRRNQFIAENLTAQSFTLKEFNFQDIHADDLRVLYELYDETYFGGSLNKVLPAGAIAFRLSKRMTRAGGKTTRWQRRRLLKKSVRYEIAVSTTLLFQSFADPERPITVTGLECDHRLDALQRVMEHELIHLTEMLVWETSSCARRRFQSIASNLFGHTSHRHDLITPKEAAATHFGIRPGVQVRFEFEGRQMEGVVNRITKRATVLVIDPCGQRYSDGHKYMKFYIPVSDLEAVS